MLILGKFDVVTEHPATSMFIGIGGLNLQKLFLSSKYLQLKQHTLSGSMSSYSSGYMNYFDSFSSGFATTLFSFS